MKGLTTVAAVLMASLLVSRNIMDQDTAEYVAANSPLSPSIQGRIACTDANGPGVSPDCPVIRAP
jgi:hypothetical protein